MSLRSPLARVLGLGAAGDGSSHWWSQRISAVALTLLSLWFVISLAGLELSSEPAVSAWLATPLNTVLTVLLVSTLAYHSWLGVQVVVEDYVRGWMKIASLVTIQFLHFLLAALAVLAVLRVALGV